MDTCLNLEKTSPSTTSRLLFIILRIFFNFSKLFTTRMLNTGWLRAGADERRVGDVHGHRPLQTHG